MAAPKIIKSDIMKEFCRIEEECNYKGQAIFFLNAMWEEHKDEVLKIWEYVQVASELDKQSGSEGNALDEFEVCIHYPRSDPISKHRSQNHVFPMISNENRRTNSWRGSARL